MTTLATVASCSKVKAQQLQGHALAAEEIFLDQHELFDLCIDGLTPSGNPYELAKVLSGKGLKGGKFKLEIDPSGTLSVYLVIDKDYKGQVSSRIFDGGIPATYGHLVFLPDERTAGLFRGYGSDKRTGIASRNRVLRI